jgi:transposase
MHACIRRGKLVGEDKRFAPTVGVPSTIGHTVSAGWLYGRGGREFSEDRCEQRPTLASAVSTGRMGSLAGPSGAWPATPTDLYPREDRAAVVEGSGDRARIYHRALDESAFGPSHPRRVWGALSPRLSGRLDAAAGLQSAKASTDSPGALRPADCRLVGMRLATHQKKASRQNAALGLMDESGVLLTPLLRRTWAPRGQTPVLGERQGKRQKVSVAGALWMPPRGDHLEWSFQTLVNDYFATEQVAGFVEGLLEEVGGRLVLVWDGGPIHRGEALRCLLAKEAGRLSLETLPPYAPELNPVEPAWSWLKYSRLCNFAPQDAQELHAAVLREMNSLTRDQSLLQGFWAASKLPFLRALLT